MWERRKETTLIAPKLQLGASSSPQLSLRPFEVRTFPFPAFLERLPQINHAAGVAKTAKQARREILLRHMKKLFTLIYIPMYRANIGYRLGTPWKTLSVFLVLFVNLIWFQYFPIFKHVKILIYIKKLEKSIKYCNNYIILYPLFIN